jgi:DNA-binding response OmpR family regulator
VENESIAGPRLAVVALVESDDLIRTLVERWLGEAGYAVKRVTIEDLRAGNGIDLIVADVASPRAATSLIRSLQAVHAAPLLLISARLRRGQGASAALAQQLGVSAVLPKPFTRDELLTGVVAAMAGRRE